MQSTSQRGAPILRERHKDFTTISRCLVRRVIFTWLGNERHNTRSDAL